MKIPPEVRAPMTEVARKFRRHASAQNMTPEQRSAGEESGSRGIEGADGGKAGTGTGRTCEEIRQALSRAGPA